MTGKEWRVRADERYNTGTAVMDALWSSRPSRLRPFARAAHTRATLIAHDALMACARVANAEETS